MNHGSLPGLPVLLRRPLLLSLGLAAIILGILGMHTLNLSHFPGPDAATVTSAVQAAPHQGAGYVPALKHAAVPGTVADGDTHSAACAGPCGSGHGLMAALCMLMIVGIVSLFFIPKQLRALSRHGLRAPPVFPSPHARVPRTPSLVQLSISRI